MPGHTLQQGARQPTHAYVHSRLCMTPRARQAREAGLGAPLAPGPVLIGSSNSDNANDGAAQGEQSGQDKGLQAALLCPLVRRVLQ